MNRGLVVTSEETKTYLGQRMQELGLQLRVDDAGYEKIQRFTNGKESGINQLCFKLMSQLADDEAREIDTARVNKAIDELAQIEHMMRQAANSDMRRANDEQDLTSIEQLAAVLEANSATVAAHAAPAMTAALEARPANGRRRVEKPKKVSAAAPRPKVLVVNEVSTNRAAVVEALKAEFDCIIADDAEDAWRRLVHQTDISIVIADVHPADRGNHSLIGRMRSAAAPAHLIGMPIVAVTGTEDAAAKQRALMAGANDVIAVSAGAEELSARVRARYKASRIDSQYKLNTVKPVGTPADRGRGPTERPASPRPVPPARPASAPALDPTRLQTLRRPFAPGVGVPLAPSTPRAGLLARLYDISSTATVTLTATVLLVLLLVGIVFIDRTADEPKVTGVKMAASTATDRDAATLKEEPAAPSTSTPTPTPSNTDPSSTATPATPLLPSAPATPTPAEQQTIKEAEQTPAPVDRSARRSAESTPTPASRPKSTESTPPVPARSDTPSSPPVTPIPTPTARSDEAASPVKEKPSSATAGTEVARRSDTATAVPLPEADSDADTDTPAARTAPERTVPPERTTSPERLTKEDLSALLKRFAFVYEAGDLEQFIGLFAPNARTNDRANRDGIRQDYENLFRSTDVRQFKLSHVNWEVDNNQAHGWGNFEVTVKRAGDQELHSYLGSLTLYVEKIDGRPRIVRLYHGQRRAQQ